MNKLNQEEKELAIKIMDELEKVLVLTLVAKISQSGKTIDEKAARNLLAKIGTRIAFKSSGLSQKSFDDALFNRT